MIECVSPADGKIIVRRSVASDEEIEKALITAQQAFRDWKNTSIEERRAVCRKVVDYFLDHAQDVAKEISLQMGRPIAFSPQEILGGFRERADYMMQIAKGSLTDIQLPDGPQTNRYIRKVPLGTVFVLAPWNYPYLTSVNAIIPAIMAGNVVLLKHATQTPLCAERYAEAFARAEAPKGIFQILHLDHGRVQKIIGDQKINFVAFTGSVQGGKSVAEAMTGRFIDNNLELGGKDPAYVCSDADLEFAIENLVDGSYFNSGQSCCGIERIYVDQDLYSSFVEGFIELTKQYRLGDPLDQDTSLGPMVKASAASFVRNHIKQAVYRGATELLEESVFPASQLGTAYLAPQILIDVDHEMEIMREETFGPVVGIMPVRSETEAIHLMNDSRFGLTASIWTKDQDRAVNIGNRLEAGTVYMNRCDYLDPGLAWTGVKDSGNGISLSTLAFNKVTRPQSFHLRSLPDQ